MIGNMNIEVAKHLIILPTTETKNKNYDKNINIRSIEILKANADEYNYCTIKTHS